MIRNKRRKSNAGSTYAIKEKKAKRPFNAKVLIYSFIVTLVLYALMLFIERTVLQDVDYTMVYVVERDVDKNTVITVSNVDKFFSLQERRSDWLPEGSVTESGQLVEMIVQHDLVKNEIVTTRSIASMDKMSEEIYEPIEVSLNANTLSQVVGGVLREGDRINIWSVTEKNENGEGLVSAEKICDYAYVTRVFTTAGVRVERNVQEDNAAMVVNIIIPAQKEEDFNIALEKGTLRVGRCMFDRADGEKEGIQ